MYIPAFCLNSYSLGPIVKFAHTNSINVSDYGNLMTKSTYYRVEKEHSDPKRFASLERRYKPNVAKEEKVTSQA